MELQCTIRCLSTVTQIWVSLLYLLCPHIETEYSHILTAALAPFPMLKV